MDDIRELVGVLKQGGYSNESDMDNSVPVDLDPAPEAEDLLTAVRTRGLDVLQGEPLLPSSLEHTLAGEPDAIDVKVTLEVPEAANDPVCLYLREIVRTSLIIRSLRLTPSERKRLAERVNHTMELMRSLDRQISNLDKKIANTRSEELKKNYRATQRQYRADRKTLEGDSGMRFAELQGTPRNVNKGEMIAEQA